MMNSCGCCEGLEPLTPKSTANRPGLDQLRYRIGTHSTFLETMKARLSSQDFPALKELKTRESDDPAIALLDAWAVIADVLTFYQERIANEGYLRTATEQRSIMELGQLVGYTPRPGVSATVYPAFIMEQGYNKGAEVPQGTRVQSMPAPGEMPQFFETEERIEARAEWNELKPRMTQPQKLSPYIKDIYLEGTATNLKPSDLLLFEFNPPIIRYVNTVEPDNTANRTKITLQMLEQETSEATASSDLLNTDGEAFPLVESSNSESVSDEEPNQQTNCALEKLAPKIEPLTRKPSRQPANRQQLVRSPQTALKCDSELASQLLANLQPRLSGSLYQAWKNLTVTDVAQVKVYALRTKAAPFGHNAPLRQERFDESRRLVVYEEWQINNPQNQIQPTAIFRVSSSSGGDLNSPITGFENTVFIFTNLSTGNITSYEWDFGNGNTSTARDPGNQSYTRRDEEYTVNLTVKGPGGEARNTSSIRILPNPPT